MTYRHSMLWDEERRELQTRVRSCKLMNVMREMSGCYGCDVLREEVR